MSTPAFSDLIQRTDLLRVYDCIKGAVNESFAEDLRRQTRQLILVPGHEVQCTDAEVRHRTQICIRWIRIMRGDLKFSVDKTLDLVAPALRAELDGVDFTPPPSAWSTTSNDPLFVTDSERAAGHAQDLLAKKGAS